LVAICAADNIRLPSDVVTLLATRITLSNVVRAAVVFGVWSASVGRLQLYHAEEHHALKETVRIATSMALAGAALFISFGPDHRGASAAEIAFRFAGFSFATMLLIRAFVAALTGAAWHGVRSSRSVVIVGTGPRALRLYRELRTKQFRSHKLLGFVDSRARDACPHEIGTLYLGTIAQLEELLLQHIVDEVVIALPARSCYAEIERTVAICNRAGVEFKYPQDIVPGWDVQAQMQRTPVTPRLISIKPAIDDSRLFIKRCLDIVCSGLALIVLAPVMAMIAIAIKLTSPGPVLFAQERYGLGRRKFRMYKFRSMVVDAEAKLKALEELNEASGPIFKMRNDPRITAIGGLLRRTSLDELPQLFNVFVGEMSLVGPRPMSVRDVSLFDETWLMRRFSVKPGLTCLWQVNGRSTTTFHRWMELDMRYIDTWSLSLDARIIAATIPAIVKGRGAM
jgi:exopolysaccharide biosynthesis polyprenyl glycosylphosphotransferase